LNFLFRSKGSPIPFSIVRLEGNRNQLSAVNGGQKLAIGVRSGKLGNEAKHLKEEQGGKDLVWWCRFEGGQPGALGPGLKLSSPGQGTARGFAKEQQCRNIAIHTQGPRLTLRPA
jgi:hypothetical protein